MAVTHSQQIELNELISEYMASTRYYAGRIADSSTNDIMRSLYTEAMTSDRIGFFNACDKIHKEGAKHSYYKRFGATFRLFFQDENYSYLEDITAKSNVIIVHNQDLGQLEKLA